MSGRVDIQDVINKSTSQVSLDDLTRKGVRKVKVLNQATINSLIEQAVDRVIRARADDIGAHEREKVVAQSKAKFDQLTKSELKKDKENLELVENLEKENRALTELMKGKEEEFQAFSQKLAAKAKELVEKEADFQRREEELRGKDEEIEGKSQELAAKTEQLSSKTSQLTEKVDGLAERSLELAEREKGILEKTQTLEGREQQLATQEQSAEDQAKHAAQVQTLKAEFESKEAELNQARQELDARNSACEKRVREYEEKARGLEVRESDLSEEASRLTTEASRLTEEASRLTEEASRIDKSRKDFEDGESTQNEESKLEIQRLREELMVNQKFLGRMEGELAAKNEELTRLVASGSGSGEEAEVIKQSLESLQKSIQGMAARGVASGAGFTQMDEVDTETLLKFADHGDDSSMESNMSEVQIETKKSTGVGGSLAKLKKLNKGV